MGNREVFMYVSSWNEHGGVPGLGRYTVDQERGEITFLEIRYSFFDLFCSCIHTQFCQVISHLIEFCCMMFVMIHHVI